MDRIAEILVVVVVDALAVLMTGVDIALVDSLPAVDVAVEVVIIPVVEADISVPELDLALRVLHRLLIHIEHCC